jgi:hypothetical protein
MTDAAALPPTNHPLRKAAPVSASLRVAVSTLVVVVWISAAIFGAYIVAFYGGAAADGSLEQWNRHLPRLYEPHTTWATTGIAFHFITGAILLVLGPIQFFGAIRNNVPALHRWIGRIYTIAAFIAGIGGLVFIALKGTIGGTWMNLGFGLYGALMVLASVETAWNAWKRNLGEHRAWAIRLFALAIGSWLYRIDYGFWMSLTQGLGHLKTFDGPFDVVMSFFFFVPNLLIAEFFIRKPKLRARPAMKAISAALLCGAAAFVLLATYYFTRYQWGPDILARLAGAGS